MYYATTKKCSEDIEFVKSLCEYIQQYQQADLKDDMGYSITDGSLHSKLIENDIINKTEMNGQFVYDLNDDGIEFIRYGKFLETPKLKTHGDIEKRILDQFLKIGLTVSQIKKAFQDTFEVYDKKTGKVIPSNELSTLKKLSYAEHYLRIINRQVTIKRDKTGRLFHHLSNVKGEYKFLAMPNNFVELDLKNSQILLLVAIGYKNNKWKALAEQGTLYDYIADMLGISRQKTKDCIIPCLMCRPEHHEAKAGSCWKMLNDKFSDLFDFLTKIKTPDYLDCSFKLQKAEADLFIDNILKALFEKYSKDKFYSLHDSIYCHKKYQGKVEKMIIEAFKSMYGLNVKLQIKPFIQNSPAIKGDFIVLRKKGKWIIGENDEILNCLENTQTAIKEYDCSFNELSRDFILDGLRVDDPLIRKIKDEIHTTHGFKPTGCFIEELYTECEKNSFHPVKDYFKALKWDKIPRAETWLIDYAGAEDSLYVRECSKLLVVAAVRRILQPGCKFDIMFILEGKQGASKSLLLETLAKNKDWFSDDFSFDLKGQEMIEKTSGKWIIEPAELTGLNKREVSQVKAYLSRTVDIARMAYDRVTTKQPRQFILIGTTNESEYLRDYTGNRRFYPIRTGKIDYVGLKQIVDQLWAEAVEQEKEYGVDLWEEGIFEDAAAEQEKRLETDAWEDILRQQLGHFIFGKIQSVHLWVVVGTTGGSSRLTRIMAKLGWEKKPFKSGGVTRNGYIKNPEGLFPREIQELAYNLQFKRIIAISLANL